MSCKPLSSLVLALFFTFLAINVLANEDEEARIDKKHYPVFDNVVLVTGMQENVIKPKISIVTIYPRLVTEDEDEKENVAGFNTAVQQLLKTEVTHFKNQVAINLPTQQALPKNLQSNSIHIDYDASALNTSKTHIVSVRFSIQENIGGMAHPKHYHRVLNYDMDDSKILSLDDLFAYDTDYLTILSAFSKKSLSRHLQNQDMIEAGTEPKPENFKNWNLKPEGLLITFDDYQVAPYVEGTQTVLVPYAFLKGMIPADSPIADCVRNKRKCLRNNLLTGGFIDEAMKARHRSLNPLFG